MQHHVMAADLERQMTQVGENRVSNIYLKRHTDVRAKRLINGVSVGWVTANSVSIKQDWFLHKHAFTLAPHIYSAQSQLIAVAYTCVNYT